MHAFLKGKWSCIQQRAALPFWRARGSLLDERKLLLLFFYMGNERTTASSKCDLRTLTSRCLTFGFKPCFKINFWQILTFLLWILGEKIKKKSICWYLFFLSFVNQRFYGMYIRTQSLSRVWLFCNPWIVACQAPLSMEFSRQEYWSRLPFPTPGDLPDTGIKPTSPASPALPGGFFTAVPPRKPSMERSNLNEQLLSILVQLLHFGPFF